MPEMARVTISLTKLLFSDKKENITRAAVHIAMPTEDNTYGECLSDILPATGDKSAITSGEAISIKPAF